MWPLVLRITQHSLRNLGCGPVGVPGTRLSRVLLFRALLLVSQSTEKGVFNALLEVCTSHHTQSEALLSLRSE